MPTFYERFQQSARQFPDKIALEIQRQDRTESLTFAELTGMAESVGSWLDGKVDRNARIVLQNAGEGAARNAAPSPPELRASR